MSTQLFLDHSDFTKSRRAVMIASVTLFIFTQLELKSDHIKIFDLEMLVDQSKLVLFTLFSLLYLGFIFGVHCIGLKDKILLDQMKEIREISSADLQTQKVFDVTDDEHLRIINNLLRFADGKSTKEFNPVPDTKKIHLRILAMSVKRIRRKILIRVLTEFLPPIIFIIFSVTAALKFLIS